jgi:hypothetical protein
MMLAEMQPPAFPVPVGVIRRTERPTFETEVGRQIDEVTAQLGAGDLEKLLYTVNTWEVK